MLKLETSKRYRYLTSPTGLRKMKKLVVVDFGYNNSYLPDETFRRSRVLVLPEDIVQSKLVGIRIAVI